MTDKQLIDKLILEWSWRCEKGYPDFNNPKDIKILEELFKINVREQQLSEKAKEDQEDLYALDYKSSKEEDKKIYVLKKDLEQEGDLDTQKIKPNADRYTRVPTRYGTTFQKLEDEKISKGKDEENKEQTEDKHEQYIKQTLKNIEVPDEIINQLMPTEEGAKQDPLFQSASSIEEFKAKAPDYLKAFKSLFTYKGEKGGRGELIPFVAIKGATLGGGNFKDITVNNQVMEVKELSKGKESGEFSTGTSGKIVGTAFLENFETFHKYLKPFEPDYSYEEKLRPLFDIDTQTISAKNVKYLKKLLNNFPISKESLSDDFERIKFKGKYYAISKGGEATFKLDDNGDLISSTEQLQELDSKKVAKQKVLKHPWVENPQELENNLQQLKKDGIAGVHYYLFYKQSSKTVNNSNFIQVVKSSDPRIKFARITQGQVNLKFEHGSGQ